MEFGAEMGYHEDDSEDCKFIADKFQKFNESSINSLPGKLVLVKQVQNSREGRCVTRMFRGPILVDRMMGG